MVDYYVFYVMSSLAMDFLFNKFPRTTSWLLVLVILISIFHLAAAFFMFFSLRCPESDRRSGGYLPAHRPPTATPPFLDRTLYTPHFVMFCLPLPCSRALCLHFSWFFFSRCIQLFFYLPIFL